MRTCYYVLLEVQQTATSADLKKAYRRRALECHPDKNIEDVEGATALFAQIQEAYEVLSDPQERAWYDSHREQILREGTDEQVAPGGSSGGGGLYAGHVAEDIMGFFSTSRYRGYGDDDKVRREVSEVR